MHEKLREMRVLLGMSQFSVARQSGVERTRLSLFENGHVELEPEQLAHIRQVLEKAAADRASTLTKFAGVPA